MKRVLFLQCMVVAALFSLAVCWPWARPVATAQEKPDAAKMAKKELAELQGIWKLVTHVEGDQLGNDVGHLYTIKDDKMTVKRDGEVYAEGRIEVDPTKSPKRLDFKLTSGQTDLTIYIRDGDYLLQCGRRDGRIRPTEFAAGTAEGGEYLIVLQRQK